MNKKILLAFFFVTVFGLAKFYSAGPPPPPPPPPANNIPIDGGVSFLIAAGAAYGAKKVRDSRKKNS